MGINVTSFIKENVIDTCSIWNLLSSKILFATTLSAKCTFYCTKFVIYECLHKARASSNQKETELKERFIEEKGKGYFKEQSISISELEAIATLESRKKLSKGELSSIVVAQANKRAFLTDDQGAKKLAQDVLTFSMVQSTPKLFGWLIFTNKLLDSDKDKIIKEHESFGRPLKKYFEKAYFDAYETKLQLSYSVHVKHD